MTKQEVLKDLRARFKDDIIDVFDKSEKRVFIEIDPKSIRAISNYIFRDLEARFNIASGLDARSHTEILYHFTIEKINEILSAGDINYAWELYNAKEYACSFSSLSNGTPLP